MSDFAFVDTPIESAIPIKTVVFQANHLIIDRTDTLTSLKCVVDVVSASTIIDDTGSFGFGLPVENEGSNVNQCTLIPLPATTDSTQAGRHLTNIGGTKVSYVLTVTGTYGGDTIILLNRYPFDIDAETANGTLFSDLVGT